MFNEFDHEQQQMNIDLRSTVTNIHNKTRELLKLCFYKDKALDKVEKLNKMFLSKK